MLAAGFFCLCAATVGGAVNYTPLKVPEAFQRKLMDRELIDLYQRGYEPDVEALAPGVSPALTRMQERSGAIRPILNEVAPATVERVNFLTSLKPPLRFLHVPLGGFAATRDEKRSTNFAAKADAARQLVHDRLAHNLLLPTLVEVVAPLAGDAEFASADARDEFLISAGFPSEWLRHFTFPPRSTNRASPADWTGYILDEVRKGKAARDIARSLESAEFHFSQTVPGFSVVTEGGEWPIRAVRIQLGGGFSGGILPGGHIDVASQLMRALPNADFMISVPGDRAEDVRRLAGRSWPLRRASHLTLVTDLVPITGWAQDNAKHGVIGANPSKSVVLSPSVASQDEGFPTAFPGDTLLLNGVRKAGATVAQSPLQFQGGNLMAVSNPRTSGKTLFLTEGTLYLNQAIGLSREQILSAFKTEFGVSDCVVFPNASFHLDYDVTFRRSGERLLAFVNDPKAAAKIIVRAGLDILGGASEINRDLLVKAEEGFRAGQYSALNPLVREFREPARRALLVARFRRGAADYPGFNMALFASSADILIQGAGQLAEPDPARSDYLAAVGRTLQRVHAQRAFLQSLGCEVVPAPSLPDLRVSVNYLNGLQDAGQFLMPAAGGIYSPLDEAARAVFARAMGPGVQITPILTTDLQRLHGALHCVAAASPVNF